MSSVWVWHRHRCSSLSKEDKRKRKVSKESVSLRKSLWTIYYCSYLLPLCCYCCTSLSLSKEPNKHPFRYLGFCFKLVSLLMAPLHFLRTWPLLPKGQFFFFFFLLFSWRVLSSLDCHVLDGFVGLPSIYSIVVIIVIYVFYMFFLYSLVFACLFCMVIA